MRIKEILETALDIADPDEVEKQLAVSPDSNITPQQARDSDYEYKGQGIEATVVKDKNLPRVIKVQTGHSGIRELKDDAYMQYILLSKKYANQNPYFPRVHSIKKNVLNGKVEQYIIELEELTSIKSVSFSAIKLIIKNLFNDSKEIQARVKDVEDLAAWVEEGFYRPEIIKDKNFKNVVKLLSLINIQRDLDPEDGLDIHTGNIMIRVTPYGPQLVLADPII